MRVYFKLHKILLRSNGNAYSFDRKAEFDQVIARGYVIWRELDHDSLRSSRSVFTKTGKLPEGVYRFSVEVLSYNRDVPLSNRGSAMAWIILNDPPLLNVPRKDTKIKIIDPTNILFTWTPRHTGSPNSAFSTEYIFRMVEIWPDNRNANDAFLSQPALLEETTSQTQFIYGLEHTSLIPGRKYAWSVQARDIEGKDLFKNHGKSEVFVFQFGDALNPPENITQNKSNNATVIACTDRWPGPRCSGILVFV